MHPTVPWPSVGKRDPAGLVDARIQAHHAAQLVVSLGISFLPPRSDDSHTNLEWLPGRALGGRPIEGKRVFRGAIRLDPLIFMVLDESGDVLDEYRLTGRTITQAMQWLAAGLGELGVDPARLTGKKHYEIPDHPVAHGSPFRPSEADARELSWYYEGAHHAITRLATARPDASEVRCWPHHFDLATLVTLSRGTVGIGLSPGDGHYAEPYYYVTPYPYPTSVLPPLRLGAWHTGEWTGAVLTGSQLAGAGDSAQESLVRSFLDEALAICERLK